MRTLRLPGYSGVPSSCGYSATRRRGSNLLPELFIFLTGAVGAALLLGTGAALLRFRRTGAFPGEEAARLHADAPKPPGTVQISAGTGNRSSDLSDLSGALARAAFTKCAIGAFVLVVALGALWTVRS